jgi:cytoskeletal protein RodZ
MNELKLAGQELRARREAQGWSLDDAYLRTRIAPAYITALEQGDLGRLPAPCYAAGFVRSYCQALELEAERFVDIYRAATRPAGRARGRRGRPSVVAMALTEPRAVLPRWAGQAITWAVVCAIVALSWVAYSIVVKPAGDQANRAQASTLDMIVPDNPSTNK